ncbi:DUF2752 domain-containing protein [Corynebacterium sp. zg254]|uniref:DUF2752 domain-containing protein n=1 Tax=Corynebacterium zhongnanshanii TaxID=2768834 RepID=A0ABQ6VGM5_9CORY|nr:DUF2752 domain-containing protein [Corynebacterium zhongnanshanii]MCR5913286.1 DUF2752 domain-containing protein [Corynebacterium sp. zg254]
MTNVRNKALPLAVGVLSLCACVAIAAADPETPGGVIPTCPTKALFGINCPGCGSMRAVQCLVQGRVADAAHYNALLLVFLPFLVWAWIAWAAKGWGIRLPRWQDIRYAPIAVGSLFALWFIARLLPWEPFLSLRV